MPTRPTRGLIVFFLVAFGIPWAGWTVLKDQGLPYWLLPLFCSIGGFAASYAEGGAEGLRAFCARTLRLRGIVGMVLVAALIPAVLGLAFLIATGHGRALLHPGVPALGSGLAMALVTGPLAEEFGWRGYLQNRLLARMQPNVVALVVGCIWCSWHIPLFYGSVFASIGSTLGFLAFCITWSLFLVRMVPFAGGSVWPAVALHWAVNTHSGILHGVFPAVDESSLPGGSQSTLFYLGAAVVFAVWQARRRNSPESKKRSTNLPMQVHQSTD